MNTCIFLTQKQQFLTICHICFTHSYVCMLEYMYISVCVCVCVHVCKNMHRICMCIYVYVYFFSEQFKIKL